jgi:hydroxymethylbilane synthase
MKQLIFATRPSILARAQTQQVIKSLQARWENLDCREVVIKTKGDRILDQPLPEIGGKGLFTDELEVALREGRVHAAVHSLKDLPTDETPGLVIGVIPQRADVRDVLVCPAGYTLDELPSGAVIGTSSNRRRAQLFAQRGDLRVEPIRGNVDTRIRKAHQGQYDAIILAAAGVIRSGLKEHITQYLPLEVMLPAPGQGALAVQCRADDLETSGYLNVIEDLDTRMAVTAERAFLSSLGGGCSLPVGAHATVNSIGESAFIELHGLVASLDGSQSLRLSAQGTDPEALGQHLARKASSEGATAFMYMENIGAE